VVNATRWVVLDVHASQTACAMFDAATGEVATRRVMGRPHEVIDWLLALQAPVRAVYEAGPTGYGLARRGRAAGIDVQVCAPGMITRSATERIKTDKRDALKLARLFAAGQLVLVHVPTLEHEQLRDLARCREDARQDLMRAKHRIGKFLLRRELYYPGRGRAWTREHRTWLASLRFADVASEATFADYLHAHDVLAARRDQLDRAIYAQATECSWAPTVARLRCLHGIDTLGAFGLCAEVCDFQRFPKAVALSAYLGLVPSENTTRRQAQAGLDHQGRLHARPPPARRGRLPLPPPATRRRWPHASPGRRRAVDHRPLLARAAPPARPLAAPARPAPQAQRHRRDRRRPRTCPLLLGARDHRLTTTTPRRLSRRRAPQGPSRKPFATEL